MRIRPCEPGDWEELIDIYTVIWEDDIWADVDDASARDYLGEVLDHGSTIALVAEDGDDLVGMVIAYDAEHRTVPDKVQSLLGDDDTVYLDEIGVLPSYQHQHVGTELLEALLERVRPGYDTCLLRTHPSVTDAVKLYEHHGFENTEIHDDERPERIYMVKKLQNRD